MLNTIMHPRPRSPLTSQSQCKTLLSTGHSDMDFYPPSLRQPLHPLLTFLSTPPA